MKASSFQAALLAFFSCLAIAITARADVVIIESRLGGQNRSQYLEDTAGFPNAWQDSASKSTAAGLTDGIGSRFNTSSTVGGSAVWFQVSPMLAAPGGSYQIHVTTTNASGTLSGIVSTVTLTNGTLAGTDSNPSLDGFQTSAFSAPHNGWNLVGTLTLGAGVNQPTVRFDETANTNRFYADAVRFTLIPEPGCAGVLPLVILFGGRRRRSGRRLDPAPRASS